MDAILIGGVIGLSCAVVGALIDYRLMQRRKRAGDAQLPGCMFLMSGSLGGLGVVVVGISFWLDSVARALTAGVGVVGGFAIGFAVMFGLAYFFNR